MQDVQDAGRDATCSPHGAYTPSRNCTLRTTQNNKLFKRRSDYSENLFVYHLIVCVLSLGAWGLLQTNVHHPAERIRIRTDGSNALHRYAAILHCLVRCVHAPLHPRAFLLKSLKPNFGQCQIPYSVVQVRIACLTLSTLC
jgi:hypothetical protein